MSQKDSILKIGRREKIGVILDVASDIAHVQWAPLWMSL